MSEFDVELKPLTGTEILQKTRNINYVYGKKQANTVHVENSKKDNVREAKSKVAWKKRSIFFYLKYWEFLYVRHVLDVMHIEKMYVRVSWKPFLIYLESQRMD